MTWLIIAGEVSGDMYAAGLVAALKAQDPTRYIIGIGGAKLKATCDQFLFETVQHHAVGLAPMFLRRSFKKKVVTHVQHALKTRAISRVIITDFQHVNDAIAAVATAHSVPITTFITPNYWMWKDQKKSKKLAQYSDRILTIFKQEYQWYTRFHQQVYYAGHPLTDRQRGVVPFDTQFNTPQKITLLPGSRPQEFALYLKPMLDTVTLLQQQQPGLQCDLLVSAPQFKPLLERAISKQAGLAIRLVTTPDHTSVQDSHVVCVASGSATLELALQQRPMVVLAALPALTYYSAKYLLRLQLPYISLPNFLLNKEVVPEFVQHDMKPPMIARTIQQILADPQRALGAFHELKQVLTSEVEVYQALAKQAG